DKALNLVAHKDNEKAEVPAGVDKADIERRVAMIRAATEKDDTVDTGTDEEKIFKALEGTTEAERKVMDAMYKEKYGVTLHQEIQDEMSGDDAAKANALLDKKDGSTKAEPGVDRAAVEKRVEEFRKATKKDDTVD